MHDRCAADNITGKARAHKNSYKPQWAFCLNNMFARENVPRPVLYGHGGSSHAWHAYVTVVTDNLMAGSGWPLPH